jgi:glyoxylase-like metal-dependent hydrolase (beta-lactamase superfamily II)
MSSRSIVQQLEKGLYQVRVPLPFPLRWVNAYLLQDRQGFTLIDPGLRTEEAIRSWGEALQAIGVSYTDIKQIVLTHHHPDHIGLAGTMQQLSGAPVYLSPAGMQQAQYLWGPQREATEEVAGLFVRHGMDEATEQLMLAHMESFLPQVLPLPATTPLKDGDIIVMGDRSFQAIHAPGHAYGQMMLFHEPSGDLFCGDHVLPKITPNVSLLPRYDQNPLDSFLRSLADIASLPVSRVFPGHRDPFTNLSERCNQIIQHHEERLASMLDKLDKPATGFEMCRALFGQSLSIHQLRFALAETLAHLVYLSERGSLQEEIQIVSGKEVTCYSRTDSLI